ncbi:uncharacterized metal-binding protein YceD (DUF177 family) [Pacificibacter maritimus]|uniref:Uncharacterized metal-binding protein YceD (DUF177 family) n=1 Tax=Pacificibacter maritimus TaxID=762213 RepID=A0A3N4UM32_9RHOB|nr:DUF177 domain-containing protein [Pacificibacter maritimus]RPE71632.1 uncharacterized metal-binding protein YceD (DUF177 family) [Pacificibacter maritimus]
MSKDGTKNSPYGALKAWGESLRLQDLAPTRDHDFAIAPDSAQVADIRRDLDLLGLKKMRFEGVFTPMNKRDWQLTAKLGATVSQACVATLVPVTTRIDITVTRLYTKDFTDPALATAENEDEIEMPEDDTLEPIPAALTLSEVAIEALALALPAYPRASDAELSNLQFSEPGTDAMTDADTKPFASLKSLRDKLEKDD